MSKIEKLIEQFQKEPLPKDNDFEEFKKYLEHYDFKLERTKGSHNMFVHQVTGEMLTVPTVNGKTVKSVYIDLANKIISKMEEK